MFFSKNQWDIGKCDATSHKFDVYPGSKPVKLPNRRLPLHYKQDLREKIDAFLDKELIMPFHSPYSAPAILVPNKNGKLRLVIDYRQLNQQTNKSCWPIPSIEEIFDTLERSAFFSTIDMSMGFYQSPMDEKSQDFTRLAHSLALTNGSECLWVSRMSQNFSKFDRTCPGRSDMEDHCSLPGRLYHLCRNPRRTFVKVPSRTPTVS